MDFLDHEVIEFVVTHYRSWAIVGASNNSSRPSNGVMHFLKNQGYDIIPINPNEDKVLGRKCYPSLTAASSEHTIEVVDVFRKPDEVDPVALEAIAINARAIWFQLGVINIIAATTASQGGLQVVMNACPKIEIPKLGDLPKLWH
ncbi:MAG: CoA-binding protein, partial [Acidimicrobiaceae bacterium]|nr:CoA-binding protein [Acidimicrobiaceae bacterium]